MRNVIRAAVVAIGAVTLAQPMLAQALGPQRQFLAVEPYYERTQLDVGSTASKVNLNGFGARLWINLDPFHFILNSSIALYASHAPSQSGNAASLYTYGAEYDQFFVRRPLGGVIDPFITAGVGRTRIRNESPTLLGAVGSSSTYTSFPLGGGVRIPMPNRFELRADAKDLIILSTPSGTAGASRTTNNFVFQAGLGLTF